MKYILMVLINIAFLNASNFYYEFGEKVELQEKNDSRSLNTKTDKNISEYLTKDGKSVKFTKNEILVQCHKDRYCEDDFLELELTNTKNISSNFYLITLDEKQNIFEKSQKLFKREDIKSAHPNYIVNREAR